MSEEKGRLSKRVEEITEDFNKLPEWEKKLIERNLSK